MKGAWCFRLLSYALRSIFSSKLQNYYPLQFSVEEQSIPMVCFYNLACSIYLQNLLQQNLKSFQFKTRFCIPIVVISSFVDTFVSFSWKWFAQDRYF